jgi:hypothetical protein
MSKVITDEELADMIKRIVGQKLICEQQTYLRFLEELAAVVGDYMGAAAGMAVPPDYPPEEADDLEDLPLGYTVFFDVTECTPDDGGVFKDYDETVIWKNGEELQR